VQASGIWSPPTGTLGQIVAEAQVRVADLKQRRTELERAAADAGPSKHSFRDALRTHAVAVIAEVKRKSPSKGWIAEGLGAVDQAHSYADGGAAAISVLTEPAHFQGSVEDLDAVIEDVDLPVLKKDFHIDEVQLLEARAHRAAAALLIVRALGPAVGQMIRTANEIGLEVLVEIRDEEELRLALDAGAEIIGINNRNLETLVIDPATSERLLPKIPSNIIAVAESGMSTLADVQRVATLGADAVLVGSSLSGSDDPEAAVRALTSVHRVPRG
jgi:indole-3-glycerol phosphate synthase